MDGRRQSLGTGDATLCLILTLHLFLSAAYGATSSDDVAVMLELWSAIGGASIGWKGSDPCEWDHVDCIGNRVTSIQIANSDLSGTLPASVSKLTKLTTLALQNNKLSGAVPVLSGLANLQTLYLNDNNFTSIPSDVFFGITALQKVRLDYNPFSPWTIPSDLRLSTGLQSLTASKSNAEGTIPDIFYSLPNLSELKLSYNNLTGTLPSSFAKSGIRTLWLNNQQGEKLSGSIAVLGEMPDLNQVWLHINAFTGPIPDLSGCTSLFDLQLRGNRLTGTVPSSLTSLSPLQNVSLGNNVLQGAVPSFPKTVTKVDVEENNFCLPNTGPCDGRINTLLAIAADVNYPETLSSSWKGNDPCSGWAYVTCDSQGNITILNFANQHLVGTISPAIANFTKLRSLLLSNNNLTGAIPSSLATLPNLQTIDVTNNNLTGPVPNFNQNVTLKLSGNPHIGEWPDGSGVNGADASGSSGFSLAMGVSAGAAVLVLVVAGLIVNHRRKQSGQKRDHGMYPPFSKDNDHIKLDILNCSGCIASEQKSESSRESGSLGEQGNMVISIQVLQEVTDNFNESNIIGEGGFGVVYKGELHDGTKIAVKRMEGTLAGKKGTNEFTAEIAVLTKVRHRNLVGLLGHCVHGNERLLVYEFMPQGTLGQHLFDGPENGFTFLNWKARLTIALDVARGVEYLHNLAQKSFIHRDLKPSNILLDDNMRAKVSDFGLVKLAPDGKHSVETRLAGTFGYLAPEYATTGRVTTKVDVYAFGVILMEMITARKALDESESEENCHLVTWFRRMLAKSNIGKAVDSGIDADDEETFKSICTVAELADHCTARKPSQRPDMGHVVGALAPLVEQWKPSNGRDEEASGGVNYDIPLSVALQRWQANKGNSSSDIYGNIHTATNTQNANSGSSVVFPSSPYGGH